MKDILDHLFSPGAFLLLMIILLVILLLDRHYPGWRKKKRLCSVCKTQRTFTKDNVCHDCRNKTDLSHARNIESVLHCPYHGDTKMEIHIIDDIPGVVMHTCPHPECEYIVMKKSDIGRLPMFPIDLYPPIMN